MFDAYGKKYGLEPAAVELLRERVIADYTTTWNEASIEALRRFGEMANEVMGAGYLDTVPAAAFSTRFDPRNKWSPFRLGRQADDQACRPSFFARVPRWLRMAALVWHIHLMPVSLAKRA